MPVSVEPSVLPAKGVPFEVNVGLPLATVLSPDTEVTFVLVGSSDHTRSVTVLYAALRPHNLPIPEPTLR